MSALLSVHWGSPTDLLTSQGGYQGLKGLNMLELHLEDYMNQEHRASLIGGALSGAEGAAEVPPKSSSEEQRRGPSSARRRGASFHPLFTVETQT